MTGRRWWVLLVAIGLGCSGDDGAPTAPEPVAAETPEAEPTGEDAEDEEPTEAEGDETEAEASAEAQRRPPGPLAPALTSVRWGPDRREPFEDLEALDAIARAHFGRPAQVAGRLRARHGRERLTLAMVISVDPGDLDEEDWTDVVTVAGGPGPTVDYPSPTAASQPPCQCRGDTSPTLHLMRVLHGDEPQVAHVDLIQGFCSGTDLEMRLADLDRDGRVELRADVSWENDLSCTANREQLTSLFVVDVADLALQTENLHLRRLHDGYFDHDYETLRARFADLDDDGDWDLELRGTSEGQESETDEPFRAAIRRTYAYEASTDRWTPADFPE